MVRSIAGFVARVTGGIRRFVGQIRRTSVWLLSRPLVLIIGICKLIIRYWNLFQAFVSKAEALKKIKEMPFVRTALLLDDKTRVLVLAINGTTRDGDVLGGEEEFAIKFTISRILQEADCKNVEIIILYGCDLAQVRD